MEEKGMSLAEIEAKLTGMSSRSKKEYLHKMISGIKRHPTLASKKTFQAVNEKLGEVYEASGNISEAGYYYNDAGRKDRTAELYERKGKYRSAAYMRREMGDHALALRDAETALEHSRDEDEQHHLRELIKTLRKERRERGARIAVSLLGILAGLFFSTPVMTGNTVGSSTSVNILGLVTLLLGFLGFYLSIKYNK